MQEKLEQLIQLGQMPSDYQDVEDSTLTMYEQLLGEIQQPINMDEAKRLIGIFPETGLFGLEWTLLHIFESVTQHNTFSSSAYKAIIRLCPNEEWKETLDKRFNK